MGNFCECLKQTLFDDDDYSKMDEINNNLIFGNIDSFNSTGNTSQDSLASLPDINAKLSDFERISVLGTGTFGKVVLVKLQTNQKLFAMKILLKEKLINKNQINHTKTEREILEKLNHPFIVKLYYAFQDESHLYFLTEFMQGGELFFHLRRNPLYKDKAVAFYLSELLLAIEYMHKNNYIYRDLKPENILIDKFGHIKLTDFGLSKIVSEDEKRAFTICGTAEYMAPEVLFGKGYDKTCDWFSFGVLMYEMLVGDHPFPVRGKKFDLEIYFRPVRIPSFVSENARDLILSLLQLDPKKRMGYNGAMEIKNHKFFKKVDFQKVYEKRYLPPFIPNLRGEQDLSYFDTEFTTQKVESPQIKSELSNSNDFEGFSFQPKKELNDK